MKTIWNLTKDGKGRLTPPRLALAVAASLALALGFSACENVASSTQSSLVRVLDASYIAPAVNIWVAGTELASNIGEGSISSYGTFTATNSAVIMATLATVTSPTTSNALVSSTATLKAGAHHTVFLTDNGESSTLYTLTVLEDQTIAAASGHSAFRFLNQAVATGAVDIYIVPSSSTLADTKALTTDLAVGSTYGYTSFTSQTVTIVITPTGTTSSTTDYTSSSLALTGGEVRTVVIVDSELTSDPPIEAVIADDYD